MVNVAARCFAFDADGYSSARKLLGQFPANRGIVEACKLLEDAASFRD